MVWTSCSNKTKCPAHRTTYNMHENPGETESPIKFCGVKSL